MAGPGGALGVFSALSSNCSLGLFRLRGPSAFTFFFSRPPGVSAAFPAISDCRAEEGEATCCETEVEEGPSGPPASQAERGGPSWGALLVPKAHGEEAGPGAALLLDEEGRYLPVHCERMLLVSAVCLCINPISAFYFGCVSMGYITLLVFLSSIIHWSRPRLGWRRAMDLFVTRAVVLASSFIVMATAPPFVCAVFLWCLLLILGLHALSWQFSRNQRHLEGTLCHIGLHLVGTAANILFFFSVGDPEGVSWTVF